MFDTIKKSWLFKGWRGSGGYNNCHLNDPWNPKGWMVECWKWRKMARVLGQLLFHRWEMFWYTRYLTRYNWVSLLFLSTSYFWVVIGDCSLPSGNFQFSQFVPTFIFMGDLTMDLTKNSGLDRSCSHETLHASTGAICQDFSGTFEATTSTGGRDT